MNPAINASLYTEPEGAQLKITVKEKNAGAGHHVPTASPLRQRILEVRVEANFYYYYSPVADTGARGKVKFRSFSRLVP